jgi:hypothetical protein
MLRDRYTALNLFEFVPALSLEMEPVLAQMDRLLDETGCSKRSRTIWPGGFRGRWWTVVRRRRWK